jgi:hypothetical protein
MKFIPDMKRISIFLVFILIFLFSNELLARGIHDWQEYELDRLVLNARGMLVLIFWAALNILSGLIGWIFARGSLRYFFQMNAFWNLVNLALGLAGYFGSVNADVDLVSQADILSSYHSMQNLYILNGGLDVAYIMTGAFLLERARRSIKFKLLLKGYAFSLFLQGAFLLIFDLVMFYLHNDLARIGLYPLVGE